MVYKDSGKGPKIVIWQLVHLPLCSNRSNLLCLVERDWCQQDSQFFCLLQQRNWQHCSITAMMHKWQTWPAIHLNLYPGLQNCFLTAAFFQKLCLSCESQLWRGRMKQQQSPRGWQQHYMGCKSNTPSYHLQVLQKPNWTNPAPSSSSRFFQFPKHSLQVLFILQLASKPSKDSLPHTYTSHTCSNSWYQPPTRSTPHMSAQFSKEGSNHFPVPYIWACSESYPNTAPPGWVN